MKTIVEKLYTKNISLNAYLKKIKRVLYICEKLSELQNRYQ